MSKYKIAWVDDSGYIHVCSGSMTLSEATAEVEYAEENGLAEHALIVLKCDE